MSRMLGTVAMGVRAPIIRQGDALAQIVIDSISQAMQEDGLKPRDRDVVAMTEAIVARAQGNYAPISAIAADVRQKLGGGTIGVIFPILSRNRFAVCLRGIAMGAEKVVLMLSYPSDEVGNHLVTLDQLDAAGVNPYSDVLSLEKYRELFGENKHEFTGVDYVQYYGDIIREAGAQVEIVFANDPRAILKYTKNVLTFDIHSRARSKRLLLAAGADVNARNAYGQPPLHLAAYYGYESIVEQLLAAGANLRTRNLHGRFAAEVAATPTLAARLEPPYHPDDDEPLPPEIEDADYEPEAECCCGGGHDGECSCGEHEYQCGHHGHDHGECSCGHHH
mgnify:CR=1 FL=1